METLNTQAQLKRSHFELGTSALNGLVGDKLREKDSPLALTMGFYHKNKRVALTNNQLKHLQPKVTSKVVILIHGLSSHEQMWAFPDSLKPDAAPEDVSYGSLLAKDLDYTPLYVRYNSGLHISENGRNLASLIQDLVDVYPIDIEEIVLIGHSLGGLLIRSACYYGEKQNHEWQNKVSKAFYLGTPHLGTSWEDATDGLYQWLSQHSHPFARKVSNIYAGRSSAIQDLRHARLIDEDWQNNVATSTPIPWLKGAEHYFIVGTMHSNADHPINGLIGDMLVPATSATAVCPIRKDMPKPPNVEKNCAIVSGLNHVKLAYSEEVYKCIHQWVIAENDLGDKSAEALVA